MPKLDDLEILGIQTVDRTGKFTEAERAVTVTDLSSVEYFLLDEVNKGATKKLRTYLRTTDGTQAPSIAVTTNAAWDGSQWIKDSTIEESFRLLYGFENSVQGDSFVELGVAAEGVSPFSDSAFANDGRVQMGINVSGVPLFRLDGTNLGAGTPLSNTLYPDLMPKAWGYYETTGGSAGTMAVDEGVNASASISGSDVLITFDNAMNSGTEYAVAATPVAGSLDDTVTTVNPFAVGSFTIERFQGGSAVDQDVTKSRVTYIVLGRE